MLAQNADEQTRDNVFRRCETRPGETGPQTFSLTTRRRTTSHLTVEEEVAACRLCTTTS